MWASLAPKENEKKMMSGDAVTVNAGPGLHCVKGYFSPGPNWALNKL